jgi:hypothetical protein
MNEGRSGGVVCRGRVTFRIRKFAPWRVLARMHRVLNFLDAGTGDAEKQNESCLSAAGLPFTQNGKVGS